MSTAIFYKDYKENTVNPLSQHDYNVFIDTMNESICDILLKGDDFYLPNMLGVLGVRWRTPAKQRSYIDENGKIIVKGRCFDWNGTIEYYRNTIPELKDSKRSDIRKYIKNLPKGEKVILKYLNEHTGGKVAQLLFFKNYPGAKAKFANLNIIFFKACRPFMDRLKDKIFNDSTTFFFDKTYS